MSFDPGRILNLATGRIPRQRSHSASITGHLATEAIAAFVDGELRMNAYMRAAQHISACTQCAIEVEEQRQARLVLRTAADVPIPHTLLGQISRIPDGGYFDAPALPIHTSDRSDATPSSSVKHRTAKPSTSRTDPGTPA